MIKTTNLSSPNDSACGACGFSGICLPGGLDSSAASPQLTTLVQHHVRLPAPLAPLYWMGDAFEHVYAVREGCLKTFSVDAEGNEHVRGFHLPGDLVGLDAISLGSHPASAVAVVPSQVCAIPYAALVKMVSDTPALQRRLMEIMSADLSTSLALAGDYTADQRLAAFLLHMFQRLRRRGLTTARSMQLAMPRRDIASYLRLVIETVSRVLGRFEHEDWIEVDNREVRILDPEAMWALARPVGICAAPARSIRPVPAPAVGFRAQQACA